MLKRLKIKKHYVSPTDKFLAEFDKTHPDKSASQLAEIQKADALAKRSDDKTAAPQEAIWSNF